MTPKKKILASMKKKNVLENIQYNLLVEVNR